MILDTGENVYLWIGPTSTEIEVKLAFKSAQVRVYLFRGKIILTYYIMNVFTCRFIYSI